MRDIIRGGLAISRNQCLILARDPMPGVILIGMPLLLVPFLLPAYRSVLNANGMPAEGAVGQVVSSMLVFFGFYLSGFVGFAFFEEHGWATWSRLRVAAPSSGAIVIGKVVPYIGLGILQAIILLVLSMLCLGLEVSRVWPASLCLAGSYVYCVVSLGVALMSACRTVNQFQAVVNLAAIVAGGLAGAVVPTSFLPDVIQTVALVTPGYWAIQGFNHLLVNHGAWRDVVASVLMLIAMGTVYAVVALRWFRLASSKESFASAP